MAAAATKAMAKGAVIAVKAIVGAIFGFGGAAVVSSGGRMVGPVEFRPVKAVVELRIWVHVCLVPSWLVSVMIDAISSPVILS